MWHWTALDCYHKFHYFHMPERSDGSTSNPCQLWQELFTLLAPQGALGELAFWVGSDPPSKPLYNIAFECVVVLPQSVMVFLCAMCTTRPRQWQLFAFHPGLHSGLPVLFPVVTEVFNMDLIIPSYLTDVCHIWSYQVLWMIHCIVWLDV